MYELVALRPQPIQEVNANGCGANCKDGVIKPSELASWAGGQQSAELASSEEDRCKGKYPHQRSVQALPRLSVVESDVAEERSERNCNGSNNSKRLPIHSSLRACLDNRTMAEAGRANNPVSGGC